MSRPALLILLIVWLIFPANGQEVSRFEINPCPFTSIMAGEIEGETFYCGTLVVPENREDANSPTIKLAVAVIRSTAKSPAPDPVLYLPGGPGGASLAYLDAWFTSALRAERDVILMDGRGTGYSLPSLNCPEFDRVMFPVARCREQLLSQGIHLNVYTTAANAQDTADLITALGLEQVNLFAVSYGTKVALVMLRDYPAHLRSVILDSVYPLFSPGISEQPAAAYRAFEALFEACAADETCSTAYPDLRDRFYQTVDNLNQTPLMLTGASGQQTALTGGRLIDSIFYGFYDSGTIALLPARIDAAYRRDAETYQYLHENEAVTEAAIPPVDADAEGVFFSVECHDALPMNSPEAAESLSGLIPPPLQSRLMAIMRQQFADCATWDVPPSVPDDYQPPFSAVPALALSGALDPITPPEWGALGSAPLVGSHSFIFPGVGHGVMFNGGPCPMQMALAFLSILLLSRMLCVLEKCS